MPNWKKVAVSGSNVDFSHVSSSGNIDAVGTISANLFAGSGASLTNVQRVPETQFYTVTSSTLTQNSVMGLPSSQTYTLSTSDNEYLEIFVDGVRLNRGTDYSEVSTTSVRFLLSIPSESVITYKSLELLWY